ncbi:Rrg1p ASCRUDRAFT_77452 [Ascoidea rubescens DSM 1968]|uniref:Uncharacterized protein n=1 Tax=Ascoidea rubescens DSM 1968 TaxID=1344418 RepID=A0A1D2VBP6_9ASCO|nr:hypothetical protein ASCRUDRAFT_77452 [Ascoidea rubescens DSM 1968]ODV59049.1 hypothetical protein ASCRUDRAFT_77452 [Ascoidea rubescens DSM 1968]
MPTNFLQLKAHKDYVLSLYKCLLKHSIHLNQLPVPDSMKLPQRNHEINQLNILSKNYYSLIKNRFHIYSRINSSKRTRNYLLIANNLEVFLRSLYSSNHTDSDSDSSNISLSHHLGKQLTSTKSILTSLLNQNQTRNNQSIKNDHFLVPTITSNNIPLSDKLLPLNHHPQKSKTQKLLQIKNSKHLQLVRSHIKRLIFKKKLPQNFTVPTTLNQLNSLLNNELNQSSSSPPKPIYNFLVKSAYYHLAIKELGKIQKSILSGPKPLKTYYVKIDAKRHFKFLRFPWRRNLIASNLINMIKKKHQIIMNNIKLVEDYPFHQYAIDEAKWEYLLFLSKSHQKTNPQFRNQYSYINSWTQYSKDASDFLLIKLDNFISQRNQYFNDHLITDYKSKLNRTLLRKYNNRIKRFKKMKLFIKNNKIGLDSNPNLLQTLKLFKFYKD